MASTFISFAVILCLQWDFGIITAKPGKTYYNELGHLTIILNTTMSSIKVHCKYFYVLAPFGDRNILSGLRANFFNHSPILPKLSHINGIYAMRNIRPSDYDKERPDSQLVRNGQASDLDSIWRRIRQCVKQFGPIVPCIYKERDSLWRNEQVTLI